MWHASLYAESSTMIHVKLSHIELYSPVPKEGILEWLNLELQQFCHRHQHTVLMFSLSNLITPGMATSH